MPTKASSTTALVEEECFHDKWADDIDLDKVLVRESFEASTVPECTYALKQLGNVKGKRILDLGCGAGEASIYLALLGADVTALDISEGMLRVTQRLANQYKVKVKTVKSSAEALPFEKGSFDFVFGNAVLHHIEIMPTIKEVKRVLGRDGKAVFIEPVAYNPAINVYRKMAMGVRTADEHPLTFGDIKKMGKLFKRCSHREFWLFTLLLFTHFYFIERIHPTKERYWKKIIYDEKKYRKGFKALKALDDLFLTLIWPLRMLCWNTVVTLEK